MIKRVLLALSVLVAPNAAIAMQSAPVVRMVDPSETADPNCKIAKRLGEGPKGTKPPFALVFCRNKEIATLAMAGIRPGDVTPAWKARKQKSWNETACQGETLRLSRAGWQIQQYLVFDNGKKHKLIAAC